MVVGGRSGEVIGRAGRAPEHLVAWRLAAVPRVALATLSGVLLFLSFPPWPLAGLAFVALTPLCIAIAGVGPLPSAFLGWWSGCVACAGGLGWILGTVQRFEGGSTLDVLPVAATFVVYHGAQFALFAGISAVAAVGALGPMIAASVWVLVEHLFPRMIPWSLAGALSPLEWLRQSADLGGALGLAFLIVTVNASIARSLTAARRPWRPLLVAASIISAMACYGAIRLWTVDAELARAEKVGTMVALGVVQGGVAPAGDLTSRNRLSLQRYRSLSENLRTPLHLVLWPETVLRVFLREDGSYFDEIRAVVERMGRSLMLGALDTDPRRGGELNTAFLLTPGSGGEVLVQTHDKRTLLPFAEYVPAPSLMSRLGEWKTTGKFVPGTFTRLMRLTSPAVPFAASVCVEAMHSGWFNTLVRRGAGFLVNLSSDDWFGPSAAPEQHFETLRLRAVETRRWLVRTSSSGISAFVDPAGRVVDALPFGKVGTLERRISVGREITPYVRWGDWIVWLSGLLVVIGSCAASRRWHVSHLFGRHPQMGADERR